MVLYDYDSNAILAEPMKSRNEAEMIRAYSSLHDYLVARGLKPQLQKLDNEAPDGLKRFMKAHNVDYQLVPPHLHRRNAAERTIQTFKDHFIAGLSSTNRHWPIHLWCRLIPQCVSMLNMLRQSRVNPKISAHTQLEGVFDFNRTPMAPPGSKIIIHEKPSVRQSWAPHGVDGWYLGPVLEHYRCYQVYCTKTQHTRIADTVEFFLSDNLLPGRSSTEAAIQAAHSLSQALLNPTPATPFATIGTAQSEALKQLSQIFSHLVPITTSTSPVTLPRVPPTTVTPSIRSVPRVSFDTRPTRPLGPHLIPDHDHHPPPPSPPDREPILLRP
jgi:hypothetical protein